MSMLLALVMMAGTLPIAANAAGSRIVRTDNVMESPESAASAADALHELGLFSGTGTGADGKPIYELNRMPTRLEALVMLVRLLGKEQEAQNGSWRHPFTDVPDWGDAIVGYAYEHQLTSGVSDTRFGSEEPTSASMYLTFVLRAMGYQDPADFQWDSAWTLTDKLGITSGQYGASTPFIRGDVVLVSYHALSATLKDGKTTLLDQLGLPEPPALSTDKVTFKSLPQNVHIADAELYTDSANGDRSVPLAMYLSRISQYMPHTTEAQRTNKIRFAYPSARKIVNAVTDPSILPALDVIFKANPNDTGSEADQNKLRDYSRQGILTEYFSAQVVTSEAVSERVAKLYSDGRFVSMESGGQGDVDAADFTLYNGESYVDFWMTGSMQNDTLLRNVYLNKNVSYYGENTFRGSALETVVFPYYWYSDHNVYGDDKNSYLFDYEHMTAEAIGTQTLVSNIMPLGVQNDLLFGKNANIIEANSFADCKNLKSVIMPCEPAHLYIADGVFANCPNLTVYGAAGGTLERYCKAHNVKFVAIPEAAIEQPLDSTVAPMMYAADRYATIGGRVVSTDGASNYPNAMCIIPTAVTYMNNAIAFYGTDNPSVAYMVNSLNTLQRDMNRYRNEAVNAQEVIECYQSGIHFMFSFILD